MGKTADLQNRISHVRVDDEARRAKIAKARRLVYEKGASVNGPTIKKTLELESMVPTTVLMECPIIPDAQLISQSAERLFYQTRRFRLQLFLALRGRSVA
jgi:hypothetical protein